MKKLLLSIIAVVVTVAALGTSTFAWFTLSNRATVGSFNAEISSGDGIEVNLEGQNNWYTDIPNNIMQAYINPTSGTAAIAFRKFTDITSVDGKTMKTLAGANANTAGYVEFKLNFRSENQTKIYWTGTTLTGNTINWTSDADFTDAYGNAVVSGSTIDVNPASATRVSIEAGSTVHVFENPESANVNKVLGTTPIANGSVAYYNKKNTLNQITIPVLSPTVASFTSFDNTDLNDVDNDRELLTLAFDGDYFTGQVTVRVWIEGWDADTYNAILNGKINVALSFKGVTV